MYSDMFCFQSAKVKEFELELKYLKQHKDQFKKLNEDLNVGQTRLKSIQDETKQLQSQIEPIDEKLKHLCRNQQEFIDKQRDLG